MDDVVMIRIGRKRAGLRTKYWAQTKATLLILGGNPTRTRGHR